MFIVIEGIDGSGKTTLADKLEAALQERNIDYVRVREPGGTPIGEQIRDLVVNNPMHVLTELWLMQAARMELVQTVIRPALDQCKVVICDRYTLSTLAYQCESLTAKRLMLSSMASQLLPRPTHMLYMDVTVEEAIARLGNRGEESNKFERKDFLCEVHKRYEAMLKTVPRNLLARNPVIRVDSKYNVEEILKRVGLI